jgi:hypothetical protein
MVRSLLNERCVIPSVAGMTRGGGTVDTADFKRKRLLAVFFLGCPDKGFFSALDEAGPALRDRDTETIVVCGQERAVVEAACRDQRVTFTVVCDPDRMIANRFVKAGPTDDIAALFLTDRKGELFHQTVGSSPRELPAFEEILRFIDFINVQSPATL